MKTKAPVSFLGESPKSQANFVAKTTLGMDSFKVRSCGEGMARSQASTLSYIIPFFNVELKRAGLGQQMKDDEVIFQLW